MPRLTPVSFRQLVRVFERDGWQYSRTKGDHLIFTRPGARRPVVIPRYDEIQVTIISGLLRTAGMSRERYFELLKEA